MPGEKEDGRPSRPLVRSGPEQKSGLGVEKAKRLIARADGYSRAAPAPENSSSPKTAPRPPGRDGQCVPDSLNKRFQRQEEIPQQESGCHRHMLWRGCLQSLLERVLDQEIPEERVQDGRIPQ